eukprot:g1710.t1
MSESQPRSLVRLQSSSVFGFPSNEVDRKRWKDQHVTFANVTPHLQDAATKNETPLRSSRSAGESIRRRPSNTPFRSLDSLSLAEVSTTSSDALPLCRSKSTLLLANAAEYVRTTGNRLDEHPLEAAKDSTSGVYFLPNTNEYRDLSSDIFSRSRDEIGDASCENESMPAAAMVGQQTFPLRGTQKLIPLTEVNEGIEEDDDFECNEKRTARRSSWKSTSSNFKNRGEKIKKNDANCDEDISMTVTYFDERGSIILRRKESDPRNQSDNFKTPYRLKENFLRQDLSNKSSLSSTWSAGSVRSTTISPAAIFKPRDEEPVSMRCGIQVGEGVLRERAAYVLDRNYGGLCGVPVAALARSSTGAEGVLQEFCEHSETSEDIGPSLLPMREVQKVALMDLRIFNTDRNLGNILVSAPNKDYAKCILTPIDHALTLPDWRFLGEFWVCWAWWKQVKSPLDPQLVDYVSRLDANADAAELERLKLRPACVVTLIICTKLLKLGVAAGLTLHELACLLERGGSYRRVIGVELQELKITVTPKNENEKSKENPLAIFAREASPLERAVAFAVADATSSTVTLPSTWDEKPPELFYEKLLVHMTTLLEVTRNAINLQKEKNEKKNF